MSERFETRLPVSDVFLNIVEEGTGPTVICLHGFPEFACSWAEVATYITPECHVVIPDQRGFGRSDMPSDVSAYTLDALVDDIIGLIRFLDVGPVTLVGHDWGGAVAWALAQRAPQLLNGLMVINGPHPTLFAHLLRADPVQRTAAAYIDLLCSADAENILSALNFSILFEIFEGVLSPEVYAQHQANYARPDALRSMLNWYRAQFSRGPTALTPALTTKIKVPTLVLWGDQDQMLLPSNLEGLSSYVEELTIQSVPQAGHWIHHQQPQLVGETILAWVKRCQGHETSQYRGL